MSRADRVTDLKLMIVLIEQESLGKKTSLDSVGRIFITSKSNILTTVEINGKVLSYIDKSIHNYMFVPDAIYKNALGLGLYI